MEKFTRGKTYCPLCGNLGNYEIRTVTADGWPSEVYCRACGETFAYPTPAEFHRRAEERKRKSNTSEWHKRYRESHREQYREYNHRYYWENRAAIQRRYAEKHKDKHPTRTCPVCGSQFVAKHGRHKYCSAACKSASPASRMSTKRWRVKERERIKGLESRVAELERQLAERGA